MKKRCFLYAYDKQNLGDDLFVHAICKRYPDAQFYMWTDPANRETYEELRNLRVIDPESSLVHLLQRIRPSLVARYRGWLEKRSDAVVYIGGSIFIEYEAWRQILTWWEYEAKNRPFYVLGANFGPYKTEAYRDQLAQIFADMQDVCFRDKYSQKMFAEVPIVRQAPDILFGQPMPERRSMKKQVLFSVVDCRERSEGINHFEQYEEAYLTFLSGLVDAAARRGYIPVLASFCKAEGDEIAIEKLQRRLSSELAAKTQTVCYDGTNAGELLQAISDSDFVVASRFHGAILGFDAGKPVLPVVYSDKTLHVLEDIGFDGTVLDLRDLRPDDFSFEALLKNPVQQMLPGIDRLRRESQTHFAGLDEAMRS